MRTVITRAEAARMYLAELRRRRGARSDAAAVARQQHGGPSQVGWRKQ
jgi:hypothetical protein